MLQYFLKFAQIVLKLTQIELKYFVEVFYKAVNEFLWVEFVTGIRFGTLDRGTR